jgi:hypothetical protein
MNLLAQFIIWGRWIIGGIFLVAFIMWVIEKLRE